MTIAALVAFGALLTSWLLVPAERRRHATQAPQPITELSTEPQAA